MGAREILLKHLNEGVSDNKKKLYELVDWSKFIDAMQEYARQESEKISIADVMPHISHFIDENGNSVNINAGGVNVALKRDGTCEFFRSYGFAGRTKLTPVYVA